MISVIIPTFNRKDFLKKSIASVSAQSSEDWELIVIDDGSTDGTTEMMRNLDDSRIFYHRQDNHGVAHARNSGIEKARGEWIAFLDSDDWWREDKLAITLEWVSRFPQERIFHTQEVWYKNGRELKPKAKHRKPDGWAYRRAVEICCISVSTACIHRSIFEQAGMFDESLTACEDYDFWLRVSSRWPVKLINENLTFKNGGRQDQLSAMPGLDYFRAKALAKMMDDPNLDEEQKQLTFKELCLRADIYLKGAHRRGNTKRVKEITALKSRFAPRYSLSKVIEPA